MIEEQATVIKCEDKYVWVQTQRQSSCGHCSVKNGCGTQVLSKVLGNKVARVRCLNTKKTNSNDYSFQLSPGDRVVIGMKESALLSGSLLIYFLPLVSMIAFGGLAVFIAKLLWPEGIDLLSIVFSFAGLLTGLYIARYQSQKQSYNSSLNSFQNNINHQFEPVILKKLTAQECPVKMVTP